MPDYKIRLSIGANHTPPHAVEARRVRMDIIFNRILVDLVFSTDFIWGRLILIKVGQKIWKDLVNKKDLLVDILISIVNSRWKMKN